MQRQAPKILQSRRLMAFRRVDQHGTASSVAKKEFSIADNEQTDICFRAKAKPIIDTCSRALPSTSLVDWKKQREQSKKEIWQCAWVDTARNPYFPTGLRTL